MSSPWFLFVTFFVILACLPPTRRSMVHRYWAEGKIFARIAQRQRYHHPRCIRMYGRKTEICYLIVFCLTVSTTAQYLRITDRAETVNAVHMTGATIGGYLFNYYTCAIAIMSLFLASVCYMMPGTSSHGGGPNNPRDPPR